MHKAIETYMKSLNAALENQLVCPLEEFYDEIETAAILGNKIYICGNGGSAAIAEHFSCDHTKGVNLDTNLIPCIIPLTSNVSLVTAIANDIGYEYIFSKQIEFINDRNGVLIVISSSGNSGNIIRALESAKKIGMRTMALVGFDGGRVLKDNLADTIVHVPNDNYGIVEDAHSIIMHVVAQKLRINHKRADVTLKL